MATEGFTDAREGLETALSNDSSAPSPDTGVSDTEKVLGEGQPPSLVDLDSVEKFKWGGKEWTREELQKSVMLEKDYTAKRMAEAKDRDYGANMRRYADNLETDVEKVLANPALLAEFKKIYPKEFHGLVDRFARQSNPNAQTQAADLPPEVKARLDKYDRFMETQEEKSQEEQKKQHELQVQTHLKEIDSVFAKLGPKYPMAHEELVLARAQSWIDANRDPNTGASKELQEKDWEHLFKTSHELLTKQAEGHYKGIVDKQKNSNLKGRDASPGGGTPTVPPQKQSMKDAGRSLRAHLGGD